MLRLGGNCGEEGPGVTDRILPFLNSVRDLRDVDPTFVSVLRKVPKNLDIQF